jgi:hypothetical protein
MRSLPRPVATARDVFTLCIRSVGNRNLADRLRAVIDEVESAEAEYVEKAESRTLHTFPRNAIIGRVSTDEMMNVYTTKFVPKKCDARPVYDQLIASAPRGRCPICGVGQVATLDHYLPKAHYPVLCVTPTNLVPACSWCQTSKLADYPTRVEEQTLHPYFDDYGEERWLACELEETQPATFSFYVQEPAGWNQVDISRLQNHLTVFKLDRLFASNAADELINIRFSLQQLHDAGGAGAVRDHLAAEAESRETAFKNSWQTAMYRAAEGSDWFCHGGFALE